MAYNIENGVFVIQTPLPLLTRYYQYIFGHSARYIIYAIAAVFRKTWLFNTCPKGKREENEPFDPHGRKICFENSQPQFEQKLFTVWSLMNICILQFTANLL